MFSSGCDALQATHLLCEKREFIMKDYTIEQYIAYKIHVLKQLGLKPNKTQTARLMQCKNEIRVDNVCKSLYETKDKKDIEVCVWCGDCVSTPKRCKSYMSVSHL